MDFDWSRYAVGGAASRPDSFTGLNPEYAQRVAQMLQAAEVELGPRALTITSAYRSPELQARLYQDAIKKYGSEAAARKWVAPPGRSRHNSGTAVDFADPNGGLLRDANSPQARWIAENAGRFGLAVPMSWEPWQVEFAGDRAGGAPAPSPQMAGQPPQNALAAVSAPQNAPMGQQNALADAQAPQMVDTRQDLRNFLTAQPVQPQQQRMGYNDFLRNYLGSA